MRFPLLFTASFFIASAFGLTAQAQTAFASNTSLAPTAGSRSASAPEMVEEVVLTGKITNPNGPLPGAVIILKSTKQMAVTNADGEFQFVVPASAGELQAVVTYAGYADEDLTLNSNATESTVNLANARVIVVSRKQQLKTFLKTARKQVKHDLKQIKKQ